MRAIVVLLTACLLIGCGGGTEPVAAQFNPAHEFSALPRPSQLMQAGVPHATSAVKQASTTVNRIPGEDFADFLPSPNVVRHEDTLSCAMEGRIGELAYCFFEQTKPTEYTFSGLLAEFDWAVAAPEPPAGIWIGLPDYANDTWAWFGPASSDPEWIDTSAAGFHGQMDYGYIAAVNCSAHEAELYAIDFRTYYEEDQPDPSLLYYSHSNPAEPTSGTSISRVQPGLGGEPELIFAGTATESYASPRIAHVDDVDYLAYAYTDGGAWQVWLAALDGTDPVPIYADPGVNYRPGDWNENGEACTFLELNPAGRYNLNAHSIPSDISGLLTRDEDFVMNSWWLDCNGLLYANVFSLRIDGPPARSIIAYAAANDVPPFEYSPITVVDDGAEIAILPYPFVLRNGLNQYDGNLVFSSRGRASETFDIFWLSWPGAQITSGFLTPLIVDPETDLRSPAVGERTGLMAYIAQEPGEEHGSLYMTDLFEAGNPDAAVTWIADEVSGQMVWYWSADL
jgi:hypothetical protein